MPVESAASIVQTIRRCGLFAPEQLPELDRMARQPGTDARSLTKALIARRWLTPYQGNQLLLGQDQGLILGTYLLLERLGEGGMGQVFKARHRKLGRVVAIKVMRKEKLGSRPSVRRFRREMRAAAQLNHPNIVLAFDADQVGENHFLVMEYVEGVDLWTKVKQNGPLPVIQACEYVRQAAEGLQHAHEKGLVHRDVKPNNLLVTKAGQVKLLDLGLARLQDEGIGKSGTSLLTKEGKIVGTVDFLAPEQALNSRRVDIRADLYSLGCTFYYLLTGKVPFPVESALEKLANHRWEEPEPLEKVRPGVPLAIAGVVRKLMAKKPEDRYQTPAALAAELAAIIGSMTPTRPEAIPTALPVTAATAAPAEPRIDIPATRADFSLYQPRFVHPRLLALGAVVILLGGVLLLHEILSSGSSPTTAEKTSATPLPTSFTNSVGMSLVLIREGTFRMGSPETEPGRRDDEGPLHEVTISKPFYAGAHLVTQKQYQEVMGINPALYAEGQGGGATHPVEQVSWAEALAFCQTLSERTAEKRENRQYRLPTEAEWEYCCRAGSKTAYCFGDATNQLQMFAWYGRSVEEGATRPVGQSKANPWGLYDVHGNVWEWCQDWYEATYYQRSPRVDPPGPSSGTAKVCRGGSWENGALDLRSARRSSAPLRETFRHTGFRVVCVVGGR
jgi:formylglycine-generating enzyme required for sulfatase activity/tRNA A-37 threonylcarbamoyl transferase component Bud32